MHVESDVDRLDIGFGGESGLRGVEVAKGWGLRLFFLWGDDENVWHLYTVERRWRNCESR
jgi:hypothetical protein